MNILRRLVGAFVALLILFEEWGWEPLQRLAARVGALPPFAWIERLVARLPPYGALAVFVVPGLALLPVKLAALALVTRGHALAGVVIILAAKLLGTAVVARLWALTQPALRRLPWFVRLHDRWVAWKAALLARVRASWAWRWGRIVRRRWGRRAR